jgi:hypothetical protein
MEGQTPYNVMDRVIAPESASRARSGCPDIIEIEGGAVVLVFSKKGDVFGKKVSDASQPIETGHRIIG